MKVVLQRVREAMVKVKGEEISCIKGGLLLLVGVGKGDANKDAETLAKKISKLRIFEDGKGKMNLSIREVEGEVLSVPQFTLFADTSKGNRPGFDAAALPDKAESLWREFNGMLKTEGIEVVKEGEFASHMEVGLVNDGPVTILLDSKDL